MLPTPAPETPAETPAAPRVRLWVVAAGAGLALSGAAAVLAWALAQLVGSVEAAAPLAAAVAVALGALPMALVVGKLLRELEQARRQAAPKEGADPAGAASRGQFIALAEREWARARRYGGEPAMLLVEVDRFQRLADGKGQAAGEAVLRAVLHDIASTLRGGDALARFGGPQVAVWLTQVDAMGALDVADRIRERTEALQVEWEPQALRVTASVGVAALRPAHQTLAALIADAESAVQAARQAGGNCVRAAPVDPARLRRIGPSVGDNQAAGPL